MKSASTRASAAAALAALVLLSSASAIAASQSVGARTVDLPRWQCTAVGQTGPRDEPAPVSVAIDGNSKSEARAGALSECRQRHARHCRIDRCAKL